MKRCNGVRRCDDWERDNIIITGVTTIQDIASLFQKIKSLKMHVPYHFTIVNFRREAEMTSPEALGGNHAQLLLHVGAFQT